MTRDTDADSDPVLRSDERAQISLSPLSLVFTTVYYLIWIVATAQLSMDLFGGGWPVGMAGGFAGLVFGLVSMRILLLAIIDVLDYLPKKDGEVSRRD